ncbi:MAG: LCP family protein [Oscillospiraceae bacterium]|nr:LCP family protein [Oscillospiraceae bacterium]
MRAAVISLAVVVLASGGIYAFLKLGGKPPEAGGERRRPINVDSGAGAENVPADPSPTHQTEPGGDDEPAPEGRRAGVYTFLVLGMDDGNGNTDTFMTATLDTVNYTLNVVNIPRDTLVNVPWNVKKINSIYANRKIEGAIDGLADILGYEVDKYAIVDMKAFKALVDAIGGIDYNVPRNMNYDDPAQDLHIHFSKGMQHLSGKQALEVVRFRSYAEADIGRIRTQQDLLMTAAKQILASKNSIKVLDIANIFINYVKTDMTLQNIIWLASELYKLDSENITFTTMPGNYIDQVNGDSYVTIYVDEWIELINEKLNPFLEPIREDELSIYTRNSSKALYVTDGNYAGRQDWGRSGSSQQASARPSVTPTPAPGTGSGSGSGSGTGSGSGSGSGASPSPSATAPQDPDDADPPEEGDGTAAPTGGQEPDEPDTSPDATEGDGQTVEGSGRMEGDTVDNGLVLPADPQVPGARDPGEEPPADPPEAEDTPDWLQ